MRRLDQNKGKAFLWDMRLPATAKRPDEEISRHLCGERRNGFGRAEREIFKRTRRVTPPQPNPDLAAAPKHGFRQRDKIVRKLSLANLFGIQRKKPQLAPESVQAAAFPWASTCAKTKQKRVMHPNQKCPPPKTRTFATYRDRALEALYQIGKRINTCEFWLGFGFGLATRISTRLLIVDSFSAMPEYTTAISFAACALAGLVAGVAAHMVRAFYRNVKRAPNAPKERYLDAKLLEAAFIGFFGGMFGGCTTNFGTLIARSSAFTVGTVTGAVASAFHAAVKNGWRTPDGHFAWERIAFQSAVYSFAGGVLGVVSGDLLGSSASIAQVPTGGSDSVLYLRPSRPIGPEVCGTDQCYAPPSEPPPMPPPRAVQAVPVVPAAPAEEVIHIKIQEHGHRPPVHHHAPRVAKPHAVAPRKEELCYPAKHVKHVKHIKHLKHLKAPAKCPTEIIIRRAIVPMQLPPGPPPEMIVPPAGLPAQMPPSGQMPPQGMVLPQSGPPPQGIVIRQDTFPPLGPPPQEPPPFMAREAMAPPPPEAMEHFNPCETGMCGNEPCYDSETVILKGPCSDPNTPCIERVSFNDEGMATRATLESVDRPVTQSYYELRRPPDEMRVSNWNMRDQGDNIPGRGSENAGELSLVMPLAENRSLSLASMPQMPQQFPQPSPA